MRIGLLLPSIFTANTYGRERIFAPLYPGVDLANGLVQNGHTVFFYTSQDVETAATVVSGNEKLTGDSIVFEHLQQKDDGERAYRTNEIIKRDFENELTMRAYQDGVNGKLDILHSYHDFTAHYFNEVTQFPTVYTLHNILSQKENTIEYERLKLFPHHNYVSISLSQQKSIVPLHFVANIYHGIDLGDYPISQDAENQLVYIGRLVPGKGVDIALQIAKENNIPLHIATSPDMGNRDSDYYKEKIQPYLDGNHAIIDGFLHGKEKAAFYGKAKAFLFPIQWEEPFGLVMIESMACGTPVIAFAKGSVPEIVVDGETGFLVNPSDEDKRGNWIIKKTGKDGMDEALKRIMHMEKAQYAHMRLLSRKRVEEHFTVQQMVTNYENLYKQILQQ